jgi:flavin reductase (DIM6/NTAB) family NADH-FMN oxidoreductase RutF
MNNEDLHKIFSKFTYGIYTLSCLDKICVIDAAMQVNSAKSDKVNVVVSINDKSDTCKAIREEENYFVLGVMSDNTPKSIIEQLGCNHSSEVNKYYGLNYKMIDDTRIPYEYLIGYLYCKLVDQKKLSDHYLLIGEVIDYEYLNDEDQLRYN